MLRSILVNLILTAGLFAATTIYDVDLSADDNYFALNAIQTFIATADSIDTVTFFCGRKIIPGTYDFQIMDSTGYFPVSVEISSDSAGLYQDKFVSAFFTSKQYLRKGFKYSLRISLNTAIYSLVL